MIGFYLVPSCSDVWCDGDDGFIIQKDLLKFSSYDAVASNGISPTVHCGGTDAASDATEVRSQSSITGIGNIKMGIASCKT